LKHNELYEGKVPYEVYRIPMRVEIQVHKLLESQEKSVESIIGIHNETKEQCFKFLLGIL